ncbi:hypothetical protein [Bryobacter aggregatus]|uniref:hypothetical protein n=1 Tax=Bryobacter aggregatus TaxID=360054 RepID=UPI0012BAC061|nr:hypothetical protein [Bryobacter aggregatus]
MSKPTPSPCRKDGYPAVAKVRNLTKVGFFHFMAGYENPIQALRHQLEAKKEGLSGSLIVLPEAFNVGDYRGTPIPTPSSTEVADAMKKIEELCIEFETVFVAGILIPQPSLDRSNSAFLINGFAPPIRLTSKTSPDGLEHGVYSPCTQDCDPQNPLPYGDNDWIATLICMDARTRPIGDGRGDQTKIQCRMQKIKTVMETQPERTRILCVPSSMQYGNSQDLAAGQSYDWVILANSCNAHENVPSTILQIQKGESLPVRTFGDKTSNAVCVWPIRSKPVFRK